MTIANSIVLTDNGFGTIASGLAVGDTALAFTSGHGARFPAVAAGQVLYCCILNVGNVIEEVQITAHASGSDSATMVRAQGATTAKAWTAGDRIEARVSSTVLKRLQDEALKATTLATADAGATYTGSMDVPGLGYVTGLIYPMNASTTNSGANPTIALDGLAAVTVKLNGGGALTANQMPVNGLYEYDGTNFVLLNPYTLTGTQASTFTFDGSGGSTGSITMTYQKIGNWATLNIPIAQATTGTNSTALTSITALPVAVRPSAIQNSSLNVMYNNGAPISSPGLVQISTAGILTILRDNAGNIFTDAAVGGTSRAITVTYFLG